LRVFPDGEFPWTDAEGFEDERKKQGMQIQFGSHDHGGEVVMKHGPVIAGAAFILVVSTALLTTATPVSAQGLRDLIGDRAESRGDLRDLISDRAASREDLRDLLRDRLHSRSDLRDLLSDRAASREDLRDLLRDRLHSRSDLRDLLADRSGSRADLRDLLSDRGERRNDLRELILERLRNSDEESPALSRIRDRLGSE
jgi:hypothetical protein